MFKNLTVYRLGPLNAPTLDQVETGLAAARFTPCAPTQAQSAGWVEPRGVAHAPLVESIGGQWLMAYRVERRMVPASVVKRRVEEFAAKIEHDTGRKPGRRETKELKEQALHELLPMAFTKLAEVRVWLDPVNALLLIGTAGATQSGDVVTALVKALPGLVVGDLQTAMSPAAAMTDWLATGEPPAVFSVDRECELKSPDEMKSVVRYTRHALDTDEVRQHLALGKVPTQLSMTWGGRVSFMLTDTLRLKKLAFLDGVFEGRPEKADEAFDTDAAIATGEIGRLLPDLIDALGGEPAAAGAPAGETALA